MDTFGFIVHPIEIENFYRFNACFKFVPKKLLETCVKWMFPFKVSEITGIPIINGREIKGYLIGCPLLPRQFIDLDEDFVLNKIISAAKIAEKSGVKIIGLGGYTSVVADKGVTISENVEIPVTTGNTYTAWSIIEAIFSLVKSQNRSLKDSTIAIIGATGSIGSLCAQKLSYYTSKIILTARRRNKLESLKEKILQLNSIEVLIKENVHTAVKEADIVIVTTSTPESLLDINEFKNNAVVCDVSVPKNVTGECGLGKNITQIKGGIIKLPFDIDFKINIGLPGKNMVYACIAETILLTIEQKFNCYSLGDNIDLRKLEEIGNISKKYGFEVIYQDT